MPATMYVHIAQHEHTCVVHQLTHAMHSPAFVPVACLTLILARPMNTSPFALCFVHVPHPHARSPVQATLIHIRYVSLLALLSWDKDRDTEDSRKRNDRHESIKCRGRENEDSGFKRRAYTDDRNGHGHR